MSRWVICRPRFDEASGYSYQFCGKITEFMRDKGVDYLDLAGGEATRERVESELQRDKDANFCFFNHGSREGLFQDESRYVIDKRNDGILSGREVYTLACSWGANGGIDAWKKGAKAVWAYVDVVSFTTEALPEFQEFFVSGIRFRLEGRSWEECLRSAKELAKELCRKLIESGKYISSIVLQQDADSLRCYTQSNPPETKCPLRKVALKIFGAEGWRLRARLGKHLLGLRTFLSG
jgi:hypothetical protein